MLNKHGLPEPLVKALTPERHRPVPGRIGVTTLIDAPLRRILNMHHFDEVEEDVSEGIWALFGKMGHRVLEDNNDVSEIRFEKQFEGATIVGVVDHSDDGAVIDFKFTSLYSVKFASEKPEWEQQLQVYAYFLEDGGSRITSLENWIIMRDWNKMERKRNLGEYPEIPFHKISYEKWPKLTVERFLSERVSLHLSAEKSCLGATSIEIPPIYWCTPAERWKKSDVWAVTKEGADRASKVEDTIEGAVKWLGDKKGYTILHRKGEDTRCLNYCSLSKWCPYLAFIGAGG